MRLVLDTKGRPELETGDGPEEGHVTSSGTQRRRALPRRLRQERESLPQIQGGSHVF